MKENTYTLTDEEKEYVLQKLYTALKNIEEVQDITETDYNTKEWILLKKMILKLEGKEEYTSDIEI